MATEATQTKLNKFVKVVDEFKANYARLLLPATRSEVYASRNAAMISDYEKAVSRGGALNTTINTTVGAWNAFKRGYATVTDTTSTVIGDAIDEVRSWFGYKPAGGIGHLPINLGALGIVQLPAAAWIAGIVAAAYTLNALMSKIFVTLEANKIQRQNPEISRANALVQAERGLPSLLPGGLTPVMIGVGALALWLMFGQKK